MEATEERKGGPIGWFKQKIREKRDESREKERAKSPPPRTLQRSSNGALNGSLRPMDVKQDDGVISPTSPVTQVPVVATEADGANLVQQATPTQVGPVQQVIHPVIQGQS